MSLCRATLLACALLLVVSPTYGQTERDSGEPASGQAPECVIDLFATEPLSDPVRDAVQNAVEFTRFNNWLNSNYESTPEGRRQPLKEHLYSIIDSHVKQLFAREGVLFPVEHDLVLRMCFGWATLMGVPGAHAILAELDPVAAEELEDAAVVPDSFQIDAHGDLLVLTSNWGEWSARLPYWFMVLELRQFRATNDLQTQLAIISTGFGKHADDEGDSQATILVVYSPEGGEAEFTEFWLQAYKLTPDDAAADERDGMRTFLKIDEAANMHTEVVFPAVEKGGLVVSYMGLPGTFEHNHQHFTDFLAALRLPTSD